MDAPAGAIVRAVEAPEALAQAIRGAEGMVLVVTGAGVSRASGIPTFRGPEPGAIWAKDTTELAGFAHKALPAHEVARLPIKSRP